MKILVASLGKSGLYREVKGKLRNQDKELDRLTKKPSLNEYFMVTRSEFEELFCHSLRTLIHCAFTKLS